MEILQSTLRKSKELGWFSIRLHARSQPLIVEQRGWYQSAGTSCLEVKEIFKNLEDHFSQTYFGFKFFRTSAFESRKFGQMQVVLIFVLHCPIRKFSVNDAMKIFSAPFVAA